MATKPNLSLNSLLNKAATSSGVAAPSARVPQAPASEMDQFPDEMPELPDIESIKAPQSPASYQVASTPAEVSPEESLEPPSTGFMVARLGTFVPRYPISKLKLAEGHYYRVGLLSDDSVVVVKVHYVPGVGQFYCFGGSCCEQGIPNIRYVFPIVVYHTDATGKILDNSYEINYISLAESKYRDLCALGNTVDLSSIDFLVSLYGEAKYQVPTFQNVGPSIWRSNAEMSKKIEQELPHLPRRIGLSFARTLNEKTYRDALEKALAQETASSPQPPLTKFMR